MAMYRKKETKVLVKPGSFQKKRKKIKSYSQKELGEFADFLSRHNPGSKVLEHVTARLVV